MAQIDFIRADRAIDGMSYPATRDELIEYARGNNASPDVLYMLRSIPDRLYAGPEQVIKAIAS